MNERMLVRPAEGLKVRHPDRRHLAKQGETVTLTSYWRRRIAAGDVIAESLSDERAERGGHGH